MSHCSRGGCFSVSVGAGGATGAPWPTSPRSLFPPPPQTTVCGVGPLHCPPARRYPPPQATAALAHDNTVTAPLGSMTTWCRRHFFSPTPSTWSPPCAHKQLLAGWINRHRGGRCRSLATLLLRQPPTNHDDTAASDCLLGGCLPHPQ